MRRNIMMGVCIGAVMMSACLTGCQSSGSSKTTTAAATTAAATTTEAVTTEAAKVQTTEAETEAQTTEAQTTEAAGTEEQTTAAAETEAQTTQAAETEAESAAETTAAEKETQAAADAGSEGTTYSFYLSTEDNAEVFASGTYTDGGRITAPGTPEKEGYYFAGWYEDADFTTSFNDMKKYNGNVTFYAKWLNMYTFEAEKTQLTGLDSSEDDTCNVVGQKLGQSYSGNVSGTGLINACSCDASGDSYVTDLYYNGAYLQFEITSDEDVDDAILFLRLSGEFTTISLTDKTFLVTVNDEDISYGSIEIVGGSTDDLTSASRTPMKDYSMGIVSLKEGENIIRLTVNNDDKQFATGTMDAAAPMIDCIKIYSTADLTMTEYEN